jgi:hypothetical protein
MCQSFLEKGEEIHLFQSFLDAQSLSRKVLGRKGGFLDKINAMYKKEPKKEAKEFS